MLLDFYVTRFDIRLLGVFFVFWIISLNQTVSAVCTFYLNVENKSCHSHNSLANTE